MANPKVEKLKEKYKEGSKVNGDKLRKKIKKEKK